MALAQNHKFTTGTSALPDVGKADYNGCVFSPLFESKISATAIKDEAKRTVKYTEIVLILDGYVTLQEGTSIAPTMTAMHRLLTAQGGALKYTGRGFDLDINGGAGGAAGAADFKDLGRTSDVAWGPVPEVIEFQPLGGGLSAKVVWKVTVHVVAGPFGKRDPLLQFNSESVVSYGEDGFSTLSVKGTLEIPLTRTTQANRKVPRTADDFRSVIEDRILRGIDLAKFRVTRREFPLSRDKRTLTWDVVAEEKPYMDLPPNCTVARGTYRVRPAKTGPGLVLWLCNLRCTYTLRNDVHRRQAYLLFLALMRLRMAESAKANIPNLPDQGNQQQGLAGQIKRTAGLQIFGILTAPLNPLAVPGLFLVTGGKKPIEDVRRTILIDFQIDEGLYLDSKSVTFSATWRLCTTFSHILVASGLWAKVQEEARIGAVGGNLWALSMRDVMGSQSWLRNAVDPNLDVIVDFGSME